MRLTNGSTVLDAEHLSAVLSVILPTPIFTNLISNRGSLWTMITSTPKETMVATGKLITDYSSPPMDIEPSPPIVINLVVKPEVGDVAFTRVTYFGKIRPMAHQPNVYEIYVESDISGYVTLVECLTPWGTPELRADNRHVNCGDELVVLLRCEHIPFEDRVVPIFPVEWTALMTEYPTALEIAQLRHRLQSENLGSLLPSGVY
jgi:hypothetical protein